MPGIGQLRHRATFYVPHTRRDENGQPLTEYRATHRKIPAAVEDVSGGQTRRGLQVEQGVSKVVTIRGHLRDVSQDWRCEVAGELRPRRAQADAGRRAATLRRSAGGGDR